MQETETEIIKIANITPIRARSWYKLALLTATILFSNALAFGLGRLSKIEDSQIPLTVETANVLELTQPSTRYLAPGISSSSRGAYVASKNGTKYYLSTCSGAARIKDDNKVYFESKDEAVAHGYSPAANCPGL